jgi:hypothetical protein
MASAITGDAIQTVTIETTNAVHALELSLRYKIPLNVDKLLLSASDGAIISEGGDNIMQTLMTIIPAELIRKRFPAFRPMSELIKDPKIMDGFIPSMYQQ